MIDFTVPDFTVGLKRNLVFARVMRDCPQFFFDDVRIQSVYGCFPGCVMNGGRAFVRQRYTPEQVRATFQALDAQGLKARLTFTNMLVGEEHLGDEYFNMILDEGAAHGAGVIVYSDLVDAYIKDRHPEMERTLSTTREILDAVQLTDALERFDMVVLNYNLNKDHAFLDKVGHADRLEVMANELCNPGCPHRREHYLHNSADQLAERITEFRRCNLAGKDFFKMAPASPTILTNDDVRELNRRYGVPRFKLVGRGVAGDVNLESYLYYLVRPEHRAGLRHAVSTMLG